MAQSLRTNIPYTTYAVGDPLRQFDIYYGDSQDENNSLICFVHGGAWISGDKQEHALLASRLVNATGYPVAVLNYRLTPHANQDPSYQHPMHVSDLIDFLHFIIHWDDRPCRYDPSRLVLIGHSCSAHMISSLFFMPMDNDDRRIVAPSYIADSTRAVILSEGIYDVCSLLRSYPNYREWFVQPAFGDNSYDRFSIPNLMLRPLVNFPWLLIHSQGDTLVDVYQTTDMHNHLRNEAAGVTVSLYDVVDEHDAILESEKYLDVVKAFLIPT